MNNDIKERFEVIWYVVSLSLVPIGIAQFIGYLLNSRNPLGLLAICILMFVLRWLVTGRGFVIPLGISKPTNYLIGVFFLISFVFWGLVADSIY